MDRGPTMPTVDDLLHEHRAPIIKWLDAAVALAAVATVPVTVLQLRDEQDAWLVVADWLIWSVFVVEYLVMLQLPPQEGGFEGVDRRDRGNFADWRNWVSLAIIVLSFPLLAPMLRFVRLVRVARLARLGKVATVATRGVGRTLGRRGLWYVFGFVVLAIVGGGAAITEVEPAVTRGENLADGVWWAVTTAVGTGLNEPAPVSLAGRGIALGLMLCGVAFITTLAGSIAAYFTGEDEARWEVLTRRLDEIHAATAGGTAVPNSRETTTTEGVDGDQVRG